MTWAVLCADLATSPSPFVASRVPIVSVPARQCPLHLAFLRGEHALLHLRPALQRGPCPARQRRKARLAPVVGDAAQAGAERAAKLSLLLLLLRSEWRRDDVGRSRVRCRLRVGVG